MENRYKKYAHEEEIDIHMNYANPPIPEGYKRVCGNWNTGFTIENLFNGNQYVWIPVGWLNPDGTLDGIYFTKKFGRRNYMDDCFSDRNDNEPLTDGLLEQIESVRQYGGFYISRYDISKGPEGKPQSVKGALPWIDVTYFEAEKAASSMENSSQVKSHLIYGAEYDSVLAWFIKSGAKNFKEIAENSTRWGNYNAFDSPKILSRTGSRKEWCVNNVYDFAGNVHVWTKEEKSKKIRVIRGGVTYSPGFLYYPVAYREYNNPYSTFYYTGFRVALCIK